MQTSSSASGTVGTTYARGILGISIDTLNARAASTSAFGSQLTTFRIGSQQTPLPIKLGLKPIYRALERKYWNSSYSSLSIARKMTNLKSAFNSYKYKGVRAQGKEQYREG